MRVISGSAKAIKLNSIKEDSTRPTTDRVKESFFNIIQTRFDKKANILDLFSGSGAIAIEFASRGCENVYLCEQSKKAFNIIKENLEKTKLKPNVKLYNMDYKKCLKNLKDEDIKFDVIFLDPPYNTSMAIKSVDLIMQLDLLKSNGIIVIETDNEKRELDELKKVEIKIYDCRKYGRVSLIFLVKGV